MVAQPLGKAVLAGEAGMRKELDISIVIVSRNVCPLLLRCLVALPEAISRSYSMEVIVVDNVSEDGSVAEVQQLFPGVNGLAFREKKFSFLAC